MKAYVIQRYLLKFLIFIRFKDLGHNRKFSKIIKTKISISIENISAAIEIDFLNQKVMSLQMFSLNLIHYFLITIKYITLNFLKKNRKKHTAVQNFSRKDKTVKRKGGLIMNSCA